MKLTAKMWLLFIVQNERKLPPVSKEIISDSTKWSEKGTQIERGLDKVMPSEILHVYLEQTKFISKATWAAFPMFSMLQSSMDLAVFPSKCISIWNN